MEKTVSPGRSEVGQPCTAAEESGFPAPPAFTSEISALHYGEVGAADQKTGELFAFAPSFDELHTLVNSMHFGRQYCAVVIR